MNVPWKPVILPWTMSGSPDIKDLDVANYGFHHQKTGASPASHRLAPILSLYVGGGILIVYALLNDGLG